MNKYYCPKCEQHFFKEGANMNQRHLCGELAKMDWKFKGDMDEQDLALIE